MRHVTTDTLIQDNETYRSFLEAENITLKEGDVLLNKFVGTSKRTGSTQVDNAFPLLKPDSTIYAVSNELKGVEAFELANTTLKKPWRVPSTKVRVLGDIPLYIKGNPAHPYAPLRLFGPRGFDCDFRNNLLGKKALIVDCEGILKNHTIQFEADTNPDIKFCGWVAKNGGFTVRILQNAITSIASGLIEDFEVEGLISEGLYIGSIKELHTIFKNFHIRNGKFINIGSEAGQFLNMGEGCLIEDLTVIKSGTQWPSPFQDYQFGTFDVKAGGGSFKIRNIYIEDAGQPVINLFSSAPVYVNGIKMQEGAKAGDIVEISNIYCSGLKGQFLNLHNTCVNGTHWILDDIHVGGSTKRINTDVGRPAPYAFLYDVVNATDQVTIKNITTDKSLPLVGKSPKYTIENHVIVDSIAKKKFVKPMPEGDTLAYYQTYNQISQGQFYPNAGQPVKYKAGDLVYFDQVGHQRTWFKSDKDQQAVSLIPSEGFTPIQFDHNYTLLPEGDAEAEIIKALQAEIDSLKVQLQIESDARVQWMIRASQAERDASIATYQLEESRKENDLLNTQLTWANTLTEEYRIKLVSAIAENDSLKVKIDQAKQFINAL
jgi:hypothetical protein